MKGLMLRKALFLLVVAAALAGGVYLFAWVREDLAEEGETVVAGEVVGVTREVAIPVLLYHGIVKEYDGTNVTTQNFREQMAALAEKGYTTVDTHDLLDFYTRGIQFPEKPVVITFDDGRRDSYLNGGPILAEHGFKAVMFVVTEKQEKREAGFLSWDELRKMHRSGLWDIGAHGYQYHRYIDIDGNGNQGHFSCNKQWLAAENRLETDEEYERRLLGDMWRVKSDLESNIEGLEVVSFAFPYGDYGEASLNIDAEQAKSTIERTVNAVFPLSFELNSEGMDFCNYDDSGHDMLKRLSVSSDMTAQELIMYLEHAQPKRLPHAAAGFVPEAMYSIFSNWGEVRVEDGCLKLRACGDGTGAIAVISGGHYWRDYTVEAGLKIEAGENAYLIGRYRDNRDYVFCEVDGRWVILAEKVGGENRILGRVKYAKQDLRYRIRLTFEGDAVHCLVDDAVALGPFAIDPSLARGYVGFKAWDPRRGLVAVSARELSVTPAGCNRVAE